MNRITLLLRIIESTVDRAGCLFGSHTWMIFGYRRLCVYCKRAEVFIPKDKRAA